MRNEDPAIGEQFYSMTVYDGKIVIYTASEENKATVQKFRWLDPEGKELGMTKLTLKQDDFPALEQDSGSEKELVISSLQMIPAADGLWAVVNGRMQTDTSVEEEDETAHEYILIRIPEL